MAISPRPPKPPAERSTKALVVVLVVFAVAVFAASVLALSSTRGKSGDGLPTGPGHAQPTPTVTPDELPSSEPSDLEEPEPEQSVSEEPVEPVDVAPASRIIAAVDGDLLIRATVASCESVTAVEFSSDGGASWVASDSVVETGSTQALRIIPTRADLIQLIALDEDCAPHLVRTNDQGESWLAPIGATGGWYLVPQDPGVLGGPNGLVDAPCEAVQLAATDMRAAVLCADSSLVVTEDSGESWGDPVVVENLHAVGLSDGAYTVAVANVGECAGVQVANFNGSRVGDFGGCVERDVTAGDTALVRVDDEVFAWMGEDFVVSTDGGRSWPS